MQKFILISEPGKIIKYEPIVCAQTAKVKGFQKAIYKVWSKNNRYFKFFKKLFIYLSINILTPSNYTYDSIVSNPRNISAIRF